MEIYINTAGYNKNQDYIWVNSKNERSSNFWENEEFSKVVYAENFGIYFFNITNELFLILTHLNSDREDIIGRNIKNNILIKSINTESNQRLIKSIILNLLKDEDKFSALLNNYIKKNNNEFGFKIKDLYDFIESFQPVNLNKTKLTKECRKKSQTDIVELLNLKEFDFNKKYIFIYEYIKDYKIQQNDYSLIISDNCLKQTSKPQKNNIKISKYHCFITLLSILSILLNIYLFNSNKTLVLKAQDLSTQILNNEKDLKQKLILIETLNQDKKILATKLNKKKEKIQFLKTKIKTLEKSLVNNP